MEALRKLPYTCLRIPTGGGKTVVACNAISVIATALLRQERCVVLWLVPTNTIKEQTLAALKDRNHPYRQELDRTLHSRVQVLDLPAALSVQRHALDDETTIIVSTLAAWRVDDKEGRRVYDDNGSLMSHFSGLPEELKESLERNEDRTAPRSLCNVLRLRHPVVIVDEAHNARTPLSFETLARFRPSCILELTATPASDSNVLYRCSAWELKSDGMIKLPIRLAEHTDWQHALTETIRKRAELEVTAQELQAKGEYLRPIALLQAQPHSKEQETLDVEVVKAALKEFGVPEDQIAIETGTTGELGKWEEDHKGKTLFHPDCPIRFILTVDKLKEGWDCPFAYVLCSVREVKSKTSVEQILGRVLRMPQATRKEKEQDDLNYAYAFTVSKHFGETAKALKDALVENGFTALEADRGVEPTLPGMDLGGLFTAPTPPRSSSPAERREPFDVPQLCLLADGDLEPLDDSHLLPVDWNLAECHATLAEEEYSDRKKKEQTEVDVTEQGKLTEKRVTSVAEIHEQLSLLMPHDLTTPAELVLWLDRRIPHLYATLPQAQVWLSRMVDSLITDRGFSLEQLASDRLRLCDAARRAMDGLCRKATQEQGQAILLDVQPEEVQVSAEVVFSFPPHAYPVHQPYQGSRQFKKHYYDMIGAMNDEEADCAWLIDSLSEVKYWVRNLERRPETSFWLQTPTDRFYPDFVALLNDGRVLALEYKGGHLADGKDTDEKRRLGELWAARSGGKCVFRLVMKQDFTNALRTVAD